MSEDAKDVKKEAMTLLTVNPAMHGVVKGIVDDVKAKLERDRAFEDELNARLEAAQALIAKHVSTCEAVAAFCEREGITTTQFVARYVSTFRIASLDSDIQDLLDPHWGCGCGCCGQYRQPRVFT